MTTTDRPSPPARRFDRGDLATLVGASVVFFTLARYSWEHPIPGSVDSGWTFYPPASALILAAHRRTTTTTLEILGTGWVVASLALIAIRLRRPRPRRQRLMRQPGWIAVVSASIAVGVAFVQDQVRQVEAVAALLRASGQDEISRIARITIFPDGAAVMGCLAVLVGWTILGWGGRWLPERSWIDRSGRLIGWGWLLMPLGPVGQRLIKLWA